SGRAQPAGARARAARGARKEQSRSGRRPVRLGEGRGEVPDVHLSQAGDLVAHATRRRRPLRAPRPHAALSASGAARTANYVPISSLSACWKIFGALPWNSTLSLPPMV